MADVLAVHTPVSDHFILHGNSELVVADLPEQRQLLVSSTRGTLPSPAGLSFPLTLTPKDGRQISAAQLADWTTNNRALLRGFALRHGAVLLRGCDLCSATDFGDFVGSLHLADYEYLGGTALRRLVVPGLVHTANDAPPTERIGFHHENAMVPEPPSYVVFFCETPPLEGGATPIVHSAEVAAFLESSHPEFTQKLTSLGVRYVRVLPYETDRSSFFGRSWRETYGVSTADEAEQAMERLGISYEWLEGGDLRTTTKVYPAFRLDERTGWRVFLNSVIGVYFTWNNSRNVGHKAVVFGDGSLLDAEAMQGLQHFVEERRVEFKWQRGDVLVIDNTLVMHSREPFVPPRQILAALRGKPLAVDTDSSSACRP